MVCKLPRSPTARAGSLWFRWKRLCLLDQEHPEAGSWLDCRRGTNNSVLIGCRCCAAAKNRGAYASYSVLPSSLKRSNLSRHHREPFHRSAARKFLHDDGASPSDTGFNSAPHVDEFGKTIDAINAGNATLGSKRAAKLTWCLAEAIKILDLNFLRTACTVTLFRDERHGRLTVRFRAVTNDLSTRSGTMGVAVCPGTGASNITQATGDIIRRFCSRRVGAPVPTKRPSFELPKLRHAVRRSVANLVVDAAGDEVLSGEQMRSTTMFDSTPLTPNLRCLLRDKAHASRRPGACAARCDSSRAHSTRAAVVRTHSTPCLWLKSIRRSSDSNEQQ